MAEMRLSDAVEGFLLFKAVDCSKHTLRDYDNTFRQWLAFLEDDPLVDEVTAAHVQRFLYFLRVDRELKAKTVKNALTGISSFFSWAEVELRVAHVVRGRLPTGEVFGEVNTLPANLVDAPITDTDPLAWLEIDGLRYRVGMAEVHVGPLERGGWSMQMVMLDYPAKYEPFYLSKRIAPIRLQVPGFDRCFVGRGRIYSITQTYQFAIRTEIEIEGYGDMQYV